MSSDPWPAVLRCTDCGSEQLFQRDQMVEKLGDHNMLRRNAEPESDLLVELWRSAMPNFRCADCGAAALVQVTAELDGADWGEAKMCDGCGEMIAAERLEVFPKSTLCAACQSKDDRGETPAEDVDYCPHCGSIREVRTSRRGGLSGYRMYCPACRR